MVGSMTPSYSSSMTPMPGTGGRTPMYGSQTPMHGDGGRTPSYGYMTPSHDPSGTPVWLTRLPELRNGIICTIAPLLPPW